MTKTNSPDLVKNDVSRDVVTPLKTDYPNGFYY